MRPSFPHHTCRDTDNNNNNNNNLLLLSSSSPAVIIHFITTSMRRDTHNDYKILLAHKYHCTCIHSKMYNTNTLTLTCIFDVAPYSTVTLFLLSYYYGYNCTDIVIPTTRTWADHTPPRNEVPTQACTPTLHSKNTRADECGWSVLTPILTAQLLWTHRPTLCSFYT